MPRKPITGTLTVTFTVQQTDGSTPRTLDALQEWIEGEWDGQEVYFQDPDQDEETGVTLTVERVEVTTGGKRTAGNQVTG